MDLIILIVLIAIVVFYYKTFKNVVYFLGITEIFFRLTHIIATKLDMKAITDLVNLYIPSSLTSILAKYASGLLYELMSWGLVILFICFLVYLVKDFIKKRS